MLEISALGMINEAVKDITLIGIGYALPYLVTYFKKEGKEFVFKRNIYSSEITSIATASPYFKPKNIVFYDTCEEFYLTPNGYIEIFDRNKGKFKEGDITFGTPLKDLGFSIGVNNLEQCVEKHRGEIAQEFLTDDSEGHLLFNNNKFGIRKITVSRTDEDKEEPKIKIGFYRTDYYTHRLMRAVWKDIQFRSVLVQFFGISAINKMYPLATSFGLCAMLCIKEGIVLVKRSKKNTWHVPVNEGLNFNDIVFETGEISLSSLTNRAFVEEVGISLEDYPDATVSYHEILAVKEKFETEIAAIVKIESLTKEEFEPLFKNAKDALYETTGEFAVVPYSKGSIKEFMNEYEDKMTKECKYLLSEMAVNI